MADFVGSSGTLVSAAFGALGAHYQSYLLDVLAQPFQSSIGTFVYLSAAIMALVSFTMTGGYKMGLWLLLGPGLFFAAVFTRTETLGPEWKFGGVERPISAVTKQVNSIQGVDIGFNEPARVSTLFALYDDLISSSSQEFVRVINAGRANADFKFIVRTELLASMRNKTIDDPALKDLVHHALLNDCGEEIELARQSKDPFNRPDIQEKYRLEYAAKSKLRNKTLSKEAITYLAQLKTAYPQAWNASLVTGQSSVDEYFIKTSTPLSGINWDVDLPQAQAELSKQNGTFSCEDIWNFAFAAFHRKSREIVDLTLNTAEKKNITRDEIVRDFATSLGVDRIDITDTAATTNILYKKISHYMLRNEIDNGSMSAFLSDFVGKDELKSVMMAPEPDISITERNRVAGKEWQEKTRLMITAAKLPYYQGILFYILAALYPFFALLLLIPGKHSGFLLWFILWLWAKSWDIGFAVVMLLDDVLYSLMADSPKAAAITELDKDLGSALQALKEVDPTFQLGTYYTIIGAAVASIPTISSYLILGSLKGGAGLISAGISAYGGVQSAGAGDTQGMVAVDNTTSEQRDVRMADISNSIANFSGASMFGSQSTSNAESSNTRLNQTVQGDSRYEGFNGGSTLSGFQVLASAARGAIDGLTNPYGSEVANSAGSTITGKVAKLDPIARVGGTASKFLDTAAMGAQSMRKNQLELNSGWEAYDSMSSDKVQALAAQNTSFGGMALPWATETPAEQSLKFEIERQQQLVNFGKVAMKEVGNWTDTPFSALAETKAAPPLSTGGALGLLAAPTLLTALSSGDKGEGEWTTSLMGTQATPVPPSSSAAAVYDRLRMLKNSAGTSDPELMALDIDSLSEEDAKEQLERVERKTAAKAQRAPQTPARP